MIDNENGYRIKEEDYLNVVKDFLNNHDNRTSVIARKFGLNMNYVSYIIDVHLSFKANYMGGKRTINSLELYKEMDNKLKLTTNTDNFSLI